MGLRSILSRLEALSFLKSDEKKAGRQAYLAQLLGGRRARPTKDDSENAGEKRRESRITLGHSSDHGHISCHRCHVTLSKGRCLNRMCPDGTIQGSLLTDRLDQRRSIIRQLSEIDDHLSRVSTFPRTMSARRKRNTRIDGRARAMNRKARLEARLIEVEQQIKLARKAA